MNNDETMGLILGLFPLVFMLIVIYTVKKCCTTSRYVYDVELLTEDERFAHLPQYDYQTWEK